MIIGITGKTHAGKSSLAHKLNYIHGWQVHSFAEGVREQLANAWFPLDKPEKARAKWSILESEDKERVRALLQAWGHGRRELTHDGYWIDYVMGDNKDGVFGNKTNVTIDDVRYPNEIEAILKSGGLIIRLEADEETLLSRGATIETLNHPSENALSEQLTLIESMNTDRVIQIDTDNLTRNEVVARLRGLLTEMGVVI